MGILMKPVLLKYEHVRLRAAPDTHVELPGYHFLIIFHMNLKQMIFAV